MSDSPQRVAHAFVAAINSQDVDAIVALMTPQHRFVDSLDHVVEGREKMRAGWAGYFKMIPDYTITVDESFCSGQVVALFGVAGGTYAPEGKLKPKNRWSTPIALRAIVTGDLIAEWRVYADNEPVRQLMRER